MKYKQRVIELEALLKRVRQLVYFKGLGSTQKINELKRVCGLQVAVDDRSRPGNHK